MTLRQAALIAGFSYLVQTVAVPSEFFIIPKLLVPHDVVQSTTNILTSRGLYFFGVFDYLVNFICDILIAWSLYYLFIPVSQSLSLLTALFQLVYTAAAIVAWLNLLTVFRILTTPQFASLFGSYQLHAQVQLLLSSWRYEWSGSLLIFSCHLALLGYLIIRSGYVPKIIGALLVIDAVNTTIGILHPYLYPNVDLGFLFLIGFFEWIFMAWLLTAGWKLKGPTVAVT
jgi:hypothetical protein